MNNLYNLLINDENLLKEMISKYLNLEVTDIIDVKKDDDKISFIVINGEEEIEVELFKIKKD